MKACVRRDPYMTTIGSPKPSINTRNSSKSHRPPSTIAAYLPSPFPPTCLSFFQSLPHPDFDYAALECVFCVDRLPSLFHRHRLPSFRTRAPQGAPSVHITRPHYLPPLLLPPGPPAIHYTTRPTSTAGERTPETRPPISPLPPSSLPPPPRAPRPADDFDGRAVRLHKTPTGEGEAGGGGAASLSRPVWPPAPGPPRPASRGRAKPTERHIPSQTSPFSPTGKCLRFLRRSSSASTPYCAHRLCSVSPLRTTCLQPGSLDAVPPAPAHTPLFCSPCSSPLRPSDEGTSTP